MHTGSELPYVAVMPMVGPFADLHVASVADAGRLPVSEREATPPRNTAYFDVSVRWHYRATGSGLRATCRYSRIRRQSHCPMNAFSWHGQSTSGCGDISNPSRYPTFNGGVTLA